MAAITATMTDSQLAGAVVKSFQTEQYPKRLSAVNNHEIWVSDWLGDLTLVRIDGTVVRSLELDFHINDLAVSETGDLFITDEDNTKVVRMNNHGDVSDFYNMEPFEPCGICFTESNDVIVTMCLYNPDTDMHTGKVLYLSSAGHLIKSLQNDYDGLDVFAKPHFITCNINQDLWIQDWWYQHVIVIDGTGRVRFRYKGQSHELKSESAIHMSSDFYPLGVEHNKIGQVIIADYYNASLHLVDRDGQLIRYIMTHESGLCKPFSISRGENDLILVGDEENKTVFVVKYTS